MLSSSIPKTQTLIQVDAVTTVTAGHPCARAVGLAATSVLSQSSSCWIDAWVYFADTFETFEWASTSPDNFYVTQVDGQNKRIRVGGKPPAGSGGWRIDFIARRYE